MKVAILGFGTVGSSVARILCDLQPSGLELAYVFNRGIARKKAKDRKSTRLNSSH